MITPLHLWHLHSSTLATVKVPAKGRGEVGRICTFETDTRSARPIKTCVVGSLWYVAVEVSMKPGATLPDDY